MTMHVLIENKPAGKIHGISAWLARDQSAGQDRGRTRTGSVAPVARTAAQGRADCAVGDRYHVMKILAATSAGIFKDDPFAQEVRESIAAYRRELDAQDETA